MMNLLRMLIRQLLLGQELALVGSRLLFLVSQLKHQVQLKIILSKSLENRLQPPAFVEILKHNQFGYRPDCLQVNHR